jgi:hypothetical protein
VVLSNIFQLVVALHPHRLIDLFLPVLVEFLKDRNGLRLQAEAVQEVEVVVQRGVGEFLVERECWEPV